MSTRSISIDEPGIDFSVSGGDEQHSHELGSAFGRSDGWSMRRGDRADAEVVDLVVDLSMVKGASAFARGTGAD